MELLKRLKGRGLISPPKFLIDNTFYLAIMGSAAYGVSNNSSDLDVYGFCIPPKEVVFPHLAGHVPGFGRTPTAFDQWQQHHIKDKDADREYDFAVYNIVKYFNLVMQNNPNMIDSLFVPRTCVIHSTAVSEHIREHRHMFLHKGAYHKFKGYSYSQLHKMRIKSPEGKRKEMVDKYGYDLKFAYHLVRLLGEAEQILAEGTLDLRRNREQLKSIRRGDWTMKQVEEYFEHKELQLETLYATSKLPHGPDEEAIKSLLLECLEMHYGSLGNSIVREDTLAKDLQDAVSLLSKHY